MAYCAYCGSFVAQVSFVPCASCGNPTNGAPSRQGAGIRRSGKQPLIIGIVIALVLLVPFVGILAAIAIPNFLTAMQRSRQKRTMADMRSIATAVESYAADNNAYPRGASLDDVRPQVVPKYIAKLPALDGWSHAFHYEPIEQGYVIISPGADGILDAVPEYTPRKTTNFDCDIIFANGTFVAYPEGVQQGGGR